MYPFGRRCFARAGGIRDSTYGIRRSPIGLGEVVAHDVVGIENFNTGATVERVGRHQGRGLLEARGRKTRESCRYISSRGDRSKERFDPTCHAAQ